MLYISYKLCLLIVCGLGVIGCSPLEPKNYGKTEAKLFLSGGKQQPLVVGFGGSEGGNIYAEEQSQELRNRLLDQGFAFLAIGYFDGTNTPKAIDRISLSAIYDTINSQADRVEIDKNRIALLGGSRGGELVLNLGSHYKGFKAIVVLGAPNVSLPAHFGWNPTSSWMIHGEELDFIPASDASIKKVRKASFFEGMKSLLKENEGKEIGKIEVEKIGCPLLMISARQDEVWPSTYMAEQMMERLKTHNFSHEYIHIPIDGNHAELSEQTGLIIEFLKKKLQPYAVENKGLDIPPTP
ncbi:MAG: acyl-CoA thioester hydrolase/BAAT C-terminal domain-containing protein [Bacteroidota bacterium]